MMFKVMFREETRALPENQTVVLGGVSIIHKPGRVLLLDRAFEAHLIDKLGVLQARFWTKKVSLSPSFEGSVEFDILGDHRLIVGLAPEE